MTQLFPEQELPCPGPVVTADGQLEIFIERIINEKRTGRLKKYLVQWMGYPKTMNGFQVRSR